MDKELRTSQALADPLIASRFIVRVPDIMGIQEFEIVGVEFLSPSKFKLLVSESLETVFRTKYEDTKFTNTLKNQTISISYLDPTGCLSRKEVYEDCTFLGLEYGDLSYITMGPVVTKLIFQYRKRLTAKSPEPVILTIYDITDSACFKCNSYEISGSEISLYSLEPPKKNNELDVLKNWLKTYSGGMFDYMLPKFPLQRTIAISNLNGEVLCSGKAIVKSLESNDETLHNGISRLVLLYEQPIDFGKIY